MQINIDDEIYETDLGKEVWKVVSCSAEVRKMELNGDWSGL